MNYKVNISNRLKSIGDFVNDNSNVIDVGCDHALLSIYLYLNKKNINIIASDINSKPLEEARKNIKKYKLDDKIETRLSDGLKNFSSNEFDTIIISGMGGITICNILDDAKDKLSNTKNIIIQSNNHLYTVRNFITKLGFKIVNEKLVKEKNIIYTIIVFEKCERKVKYSYDELKYGIKVKNDKLYDEFIKIELKKEINKLYNIPKRYIILRLKTKKNIKILNKILTTKNKSNY